MNKLHKIFNILIILVFLTHNYAFAQEIKEIKINGAHRIEKETVLNYLNLKIGDEINVVDQSNCIKNLYNTKFFENVKINFDNGVLDVILEEYPLIVQVEFKNNNKIKSSTLKDEIHTQIGYSLNKHTINDDILKIKDLYKAQSKFLLDVVVKIEKLKNHRVKVIFDFKEGPPSDIKNIIFIGNKQVSSIDLKSVLISKQKNILKFWASSNYDPNKLEYDKYVLNNYYRSLGYADFSIISVNPQISKCKNYFDIIYVIDEGVKYKLRKVEINNNIAGIDEKSLKKIISIHPGNAYNDDRITHIALQISNYLGNKGYADIDVVPVIKEKNFEEKYIDISFTISETSRSYIKKINIIGNLKTRDRIIRNQFDIAEGDLYNIDKLRQVQRNLQALDFFETVKVNQVPTNIANYRDLNIVLQEKSTASFGLEGAYGSSDGWNIGLNYAERNFLGKGQLLNASIKTSLAALYGNIAMAEKNFLDRNLKLANILTFDQRKEQDKKTKESVVEQQPYDSVTMADKLSFGYDITNDLSHQLYYLLKYENLSSKDKEKLSPDIKEEIGEYYTSAIGHSLTYDNVDNNVLPKNGFKINLSNEYAGVLAGSVYNKIDGSFAAFRSFYDNKYTFKILSSAGFIKGGDKGTRIKDRFTLGYAKVRGYSKGLGPVRRDYETDCLGGEKFYQITAEFSFPIMQNTTFNIVGHIFLDHGALWQSGIKNNSFDILRNDYDPVTTCGIGAIIITPLVPIKLDYVFWHKDSKDSLGDKVFNRQNFHFSIHVGL